ncbi:polyhydroxyalkanoate synthesis repressor PhaR [Sulfitobacter pontiacus]
MQHAIWEGSTVTETVKPLLIKRYASRRLYNTETSDYVTLDDISGFIRDGREVQIVDLKSGDDLTRQYLLQIIAEHESRGKSVLPVDVLNDLVRSYMSPDASVVPQFLKTSFDMLRDGQARVLENMNTINPMAKMPGFEVMQAQQEAFMKAMTGNMPTPWNGMGKTDQRPASAKGDDAESLDAIKQQLAELQEKLSKLK